MFLGVKRVFFRFLAKVHRLLKIKSHVKVVIINNCLQLFIARVWKYPTFIINIKYDIFDIIDFNDIFYIYKIYKKEA